MKKINAYILICLILTLGYFIGVLKFLTENEEDKCEMTYMFEYPQYVKVTNKADKIFKKYGLYAYSEGRLTEKSRNMYFDGIPILFIPGNKGSHKQVRSLASVALRKWLNSRLPFHFDYFTIDLNEEYSGIYGPLLYDQLEYVNASLYRILELYQGKKDPPKSVILIGHSMGGVIGMKLLSEIENPNLVPILITLASPLRRAPMIMDYHLETFYSGIFKKNKNLTNIISVAGGYRDILISPFLTIKREMDILHVMTSNIPISWTECNHVQIMWCKQVVMVLNRALFGSVDTRINKISSNSTHRKMAFKHHLVQHSGIKIRNSANYFKPVQMNQKGQWIENLHKQYSVVHKNGLNEIQWYMIALTNFPGYEHVSILAINMEIVDWIFACNAYFIKDSSRICREGVHMTHKSEIAPSAKYKRRFFNMNLKNLKKERPDFSHIVFRALPTDEPLEYHVDVYGQNQRSLIVQLPAWFSIGNHVIIERTAEKAVYYELTLPQLSYIIQYYYLFLEPIDCSKLDHHASVTLTVPWSNENYHGFFSNNMKKPFNVRLFTPKPINYGNKSAVIKLILDPSCRYSISVKSSIVGMLGQIARTYTPLLLTNIAVVALVSLRHQYKSLQKGYCSILFIAIQEGARPYYVLPACKILSSLLNLWFLPSFIPKPDHFYIIDEGLDFFVLPFILYFCSVGIFWILAVTYSISLIALESTVHKLTLKLLARTVSFNMAWSDYVLSYLQKVPIIVALTLICLSISTCGGLALCLGACFYFLRLTHMSQDFMEEVVWYLVKQFGIKCKAFFKKSKTDPVNRAIPKKNERQVEEKCDNLENKEENDVKTQENLNNGKLILKSDIPPGQYIKEEVINLNKRGDGDTIVQTKEDNKFEIVSEELKGNIDSEENKNIQCDNETDEFEENQSKISLEVKTLDENNEKIEQVTSQNIQKCKTEDKGDSPEGELDLSSSYNAIFFHSTLFFLWCIVTVINIPAVLTWAHNFKYTTALVPDDSFIPGFALSLCALALWELDLPKTNRKWMKEVENFIWLMAIISLAFATISLYRLNYILTLTIIVITLHQVLAPTIDSCIDEEDSDENSHSEKDEYSDLKMKME